MNEQQLYSVDRFEGDMVVLIDDAGHSASVSIALLPEGVKNGDILVMQDGAYRFDVNTTEMRRNYALSLQQKLRSKYK